MSQEIPQGAEVLITIKRGGTAVISVNGVKGADCKAITAPLEARLGMVTATQETEEYYEPAESLQHSDRSGW